MSASAATASPRSRQRDGYSGTSQIITSAERKAIETAEIPGAALGLSIEVKGGHARKRSLGDGRPASCRIRCRGRCLLCQPHDRRAALGAGHRCPGADRAGRWRRFWIGHHTATCSSSAMGPSALCCSATTAKSLSAGARSTGRRRQLLYVRQKRPARSAVLATHREPTTP